VLRWLVYAAITTLFALSRQALVTLLVPMRHYDSRPRKLKTNFGKRSRLAFPLTLAQGLYGVLVTIQTLPVLGILAIFQHSVLKFLPVVEVALGLALCLGPTTNPS
jgi:hypothetical protein